MIAKRSTSSIREPFKIIFWFVSTVWLDFVNKGVKKGHFH
jgi:hypothetical protein